MAEFYTVKALTLLLLPPSGLFLLFFLGLALHRRRRPRLGMGLMISAGFLLYLLSIPAFVSGKLRPRMAFHYPPLPDTAKMAGQADAIVLLGGGLVNNPEYGGPDVGISSLARGRYAAWLHRRTGLPILVTGDALLTDAMQRLLEQEFRVPVRWLEACSRNTADNARYSRAMLAAEGIDSILLVTSGGHMHRAVKAFEGTGFQVLPTPTLSASKARRPLPLLQRYVPQAASLNGASNLMHEYFGRLWYRLRYFGGKGAAPGRRAPKPDALSRGAAAGKETAPGRRGAVAASCEGKDETETAPGRRAAEPNAATREAGAGTETTDSPRAPESSVPAPAAGAGEETATGRGDPAAPAFF